MMTITENIPSCPMKQAWGPLAAEGLALPGTQAPSDSLKPTHGGPQSLRF